MTTLALRLLTQDGPSAVVVAPAEAKEAPTAALSAKVTERLVRSLVGRGVVVRHSAFAAEGSPDADRLRKASVRAREQYTMLELEAAERSLEEALAEVGPRLAEPGVVDAVVEAAVLLGAVRLGQDRVPSSREAFMRALRLRPGHRVDAAQLPPDVVEAFEQVRIALHAAPAGGIEVASDPPLARVIVDGRERGQAPLTVNLPAGAHAVVVEHPGRLSVRRVVEVKPGAPGSLQASLLPDPVEEGKAKVAAAAASTSREAAVVEAGRLLNTARVASVFLVGFAPAGDEWRVTLARVDGDGGVRVTFAFVDRALFRLDAVSEALTAAATASSAGDGPVLVSPVEVGSEAIPPLAADELARVVEAYRHRLLGGAPVLPADGQASSTSPGGEVDESGAGWLYAGAGAGGAAALGMVAVGAAAAGAAAWYFMLGPGSTPPPVDTVGLQVVIE